jgi:VIT1/CCC1 family predicted Fe2+/Mn2+ transporter
VGWLRASVLGANDGLISTSSLIVGVAASGAERPAILIAGAAGLIAGAMSMAAGEYVSVSSQADTESADLARERRELEVDFAAEKAELIGIYIQRGLSPDLAGQVAEQLMAHDPLGAHARDELGLSPVLSARPLQAALASAGSFALGAGIPVLLTALGPVALLSTAIPLLTLALLAVLGALAAKVGNASAWRGSARVVVWGAVAMLASAIVGTLFGASA